MKANLNDLENTSDIIVINNPKILDTVYLITTTEFGCGDKDYSKKLMISFLRTLADKEPFPKAIIFMNSAVVFTSVNTNALEIVRNLEWLGIDILTSYDCISYYKLLEEHKIGRIANLFEIHKIIKNTRNVIKL